MFVEGGNGSFSCDLVKQICYLNRWNNKNYVTAKGWIHWDHFYVADDSAQEHIKLLTSLKQALNDQL
jgi:hypothetical protein